AVIACGALLVGIRVTGRDVSWRYTRSIAPDESAIQRLLPATARPVGTPPTSTTCATRWLAGSTREIEPSPAFATQTEPPPRATGDGRSPTGTAGTSAIPLLGSNWITVTAS